MNLSNSDLSFTASLLDIWSSCWLNRKAAVIHGGGFIQILKQRLVYEACWQDLVVFIFVKYFNDEMKNLIKTNYYLSLVLPCWFRMLLFVSFKRPNPFCLGLLENIQISTRPLLVCLTFERWDLLELLEFLYLQLITKHMCVHVHTFFDLEEADIE